MAELRILAPAARFILQGGAVARRAAGDAFGVALPEDACRANTAGDRAALWLGPDEHLLLAPAGEAESIAAQLASALAGIPHSLVEVSARQVAMQVSGPDASELLNSGCPLDLDPVAFPPGMCTRTIIGKAEAVLWRKSAAEYHLEVWRSFAGYVVDWLREAGGSEKREITGQ
jgi:sarcosine oxidase, subunit gamma